MQAKIKYYIDLGNDQHAMVGYKRFLAPAIRMLMIARDSNVWLEKDLQELSLPLLNLSEHELLSARASKVLLTYEWGRSYHCSVKTMSVRTY